MVCSENALLLQKILEKKKRKKKAGKRSTIFKRNLKFSDLEKIKDTEKKISKSF